MGAQPRRGPGRAADPGRQRAAGLPARPPVRARRHRLDRAGGGRPPGATFGRGRPAWLLPDAREAGLRSVGRAGGLGARLGRGWPRRRRGAADRLRPRRARLRRHPAGLSGPRKVDPLAARARPTSPCTRLPAVMAAAEREGAQRHLTQAQFLARMGIGERAEAFVRARPDKAALIGRQLTASSRRPDGRPVQGLRPPLAGLDAPRVRPGGVSWRSGRPPVLTSPLLPPGIRHAFFTRQGGVSQDLRQPQRRRGLRDDSTPCARTAAARRSPRRRAGHRLPDPFRHRLRRRRPGRRAAAGDGCSPRPA